MTDADQQIMDTPIVIDKEANRIPGPSVAVMIVILLIAFACTGFSIMFNILESQNSTPIPAETTKDYIVEAKLPTGIAARVNNTDIPEEVVTEYIMRMRNGAQAYTDEEWTDWLYEQGYTMDNLRNTIIQYYINLEVTDQAATALGIEVSQDDIDAALAEHVETFGGWDAVKADMEKDGRDMDHMYRWAKSAAQKEKMRAALNQIDFDSPEFDQVVLRSIKVSYPEYADVQSLDEVDPETVLKAREYIINVTNEEAYVNFMNAFQEESVIERAPRPSGLPYESNVDLKLNFAIIKSMFESAMNGDLQSGSNVTPMEP